MSYHKIIFVLFLVFSLSIQGCILSLSDKNADEDGVTEGDVTSDLLQPGENPLNGENAENIGLLDDLTNAFGVSASIKLAEVEAGLTGGVIVVSDETNPLYGSTITIPAGALTETTTITVYQVNSINTPVGVFQPLSAALRIEAANDKDPANYITITIPYSTKIFDEREKKIDEVVEEITNSFDSAIFYSGSYSIGGYLSTIVDFSGSGQIEASLEVESLEDSTNYLYKKRFKYEEDERPIYSQGVLTIKTAKWGTYQFVDGGFFYDVNSLSITEHTCLPETYWSNIDVSKLIASSGTYPSENWETGLADAIYFSFSVLGGDSVIGIMRDNSGGNCGRSDFKTTKTSETCYEFPPIKIENQYGYGIYYDIENDTTESTNVIGYYGGDSEYKSPRDNKIYNNFLCIDTNIEEWLENPQEFESFFKKISYEEEGTIGSCALFNLTFTETQQKFEYDSEGIDFKVKYDISIEGDIEVADILNYIKNDPNLSYGFFTGLNIDSETATSIINSFTLPCSYTIEGTLTRK